MTNQLGFVAHLARRWLKKYTRTCPGLGYVLAKVWDKKSWDRKSGYRVLVLLKVVSNYICLITNPCLFPLL